MKKNPDERSEPERRQQQLGHESHNGTVIRQLIPVINANFSKALGSS